MANIRPFRTTFPALYIGHLPQELPYSQAFELFKPLGVLMKEDFNLNRTNPYGFICVADHPTALRLQQELRTRDYRFGKKQLQAGDIRNYGITHEAIAQEMRTSMPAPMRNWAQAMRDFKAGIELYYGYTVYVNNLPKGIPVLHLGELFASIGPVKAFSNAGQHTVRASWAFVTYHTNADAQQAVLELNDYVLYGHPLGVTRAELGREINASLNDKIRGNEESESAEEHDQPQNLLEDNENTVETSNSAASKDNDISTSLTGQTVHQITTNMAALSATKKQDPAVLVPSQAALNSLSENTPVNQDERLTTDILALGSDILSIAGAILNERDRFRVETIEQAVQQMVEIPAVREAVEKLLRNEHLVYRAL